MKRLKYIAYTALCASLFLSSCDLERYRSEERRVGKEC